MASLLHRFWITFASNPGYSGVHEAFGLGVGVTAYTFDDALAILEECMFREGVPGVDNVVVDVKYEDLEVGHVRPS